MGPRTGLDSAENLAPTGIRSPDRPARSESLYRLSYRAPKERLCNTQKLCYYLSLSLYVSFVSLGKERTFVNYRMEQQ